MWDSVPRPVAAYEISPGRFFASAMKSGNVVTPSEDATVMKNGCSATKPTGTKSRGSSSGRLACRPGSVTRADDAGM